VPRLKHGRQWASGRGEGRKREDVRAGFVSLNLIIETEIIVITNASHALYISKGAWSFVFDTDVRKLQGRGKGGRHTKQAKSKSIQIKSLRPSHPPT
jgi:hypothetical protein